MLKGKRRLLPPSLMPLSVLIPFKATAAYHSCSHSPRAHPLKTFDSKLLNFSCAVPFFFAALSSCHWWSERNVTVKFRSRAPITVHR